MLPASTMPKSGHVLVSHHCRVSSMTYSLHLNMMIRQMVSRGWVYPLRVSRLTYTAPNFVGDNPEEWFNVENYVQFLAERTRSIIRRAAKEHTVQEIRDKAIDI